MADSLLLSPDEIEAITGYRRPSDQVRELLRQGFMRARRNGLGGVVLEREHYKAVCNGHFGVAPQSERPRVFPLLRSMQGDRAKESKG